MVRFVTLETSDWEIVTMAKKDELASVETTNRVAEQLAEREAEIARVMVPWSRQEAGDERNRAG
jgi:hypothetical protein